MSIWSSMGTEVRGLHNNGPDANYRGEGEPAAQVDVATATSYHGLIRLAVWSDDRSEDAEALLTVEAARTLAANLRAAIGEIEARRGN